LADHPQSEAAVLFAAAFVRFPTLAVAYGQLKERRVLALLESTSSGGKAEGKRSRGRLNGLGTELTAISILP